MLTSAKVGEWTRMGMPNPRASPLTSWVLPAPSSPERPMTSPACAVRPQVSPKVSVSAGLCEMYVAMGRQWPNTLFIPNGDSLSSGYFPDATQGQIGKLFFPGIQQRDRLTAGECE